MQTSSTCPSCGGEGQIISDKCKTCFGDGIIKAEDAISIKIPAGVADGMQLSVTGRGNAAARGGIPGDLLVVIEEEEHPQLKREGNNLHYEQYISFSEAALGTTVEVPTIGGKAKIKIDPGTHANKILRLRGKGLPEVNGYEKGDLMVNVNVWTPQQLTKEEKKIMEQLSNSENFKPRPTSKDKSFFERMKEYFN
jgi:molecular chaperone DnaJ